MAAIDNLTQNYTNIQTRLSTETGDAEITVSGVSGNEGLTLDYNLLTAPKRFKIDPTGAHWTDFTTSYDTTLENLVSGLQAIVPPPNATTFKVVNTIVASNNATNSITANSTVPNIVITDGTTTNTIDKSGYTTRNSVQNLTHYLNFSDSSSTGVGAIQKTAGLTCNPSTNSLSATTLNTDNLNSTSSYYINSSKRIYQTLNAYTGYANTTNGYYSLAKNAYPLPNKNSSGVKAVSVWTQRNLPANSSCQILCWSPELMLFCGALSNGSVLTSPDGITWTNTLTGTSVAYGSVCWSSQLGIFCAIGLSGAMTSPNGTVWTAQSVPAVYVWKDICWSPELGIFCAVAQSGGAQNIITSPDGITWTPQTGANSLAYRGICWAPELGLFCAVNQSATGFGAMTSPDGITWTARPTPSGIFQQVCWSPELGLFCATAGVGVITSPDGITWTAQTIPNITHFQICWAPQLGLFCAVNSVGAGFGITTSPNGTIWTQRTTPTQQFRACCWAPELGIFAAIVFGTTTTNGAMTSSLKGRPPTSYNTFDSGFNSIDQTGAWTINGTITNANNVNITSDNTSGNYFIPFTKTGVGNKPLFQDDTTGPLTYNPSTSVLSAAQLTATTQVNTTLVSTTGTLSLNTGTGNRINLTNTAGTFLNDATSASNGTQTLPTLAASFLRININGTDYKIALFNN
jgi:hypothetical protein